MGNIKIAIVGGGNCAKLVLSHGQGGILKAPSAYFCKHPLQQFTDVPDDGAFYQWRLR
jgi:myo-inositol-1-phosphate synthase